jgi:hypothetical protein
VGREEGEVQIYKVAKAATGNHLVLTSVGNLALSRKLEEGLGRGTIILNF